MIITTLLQTLRLTAHIAAVVVVRVVVSSAKRRNGSESTQFRNPAGVLTGRGFSYLPPIKSGLVKRTQNNGCSTR